MDTEQNINQNEGAELYIPMLPSQKKRFGLMLSSAVPGAILILSAISSKQETGGLMAIKVFSCVAGFLVIFSSVREFLKPGSYKWMGADTITVFTGFLIIALGANMFDAFKGFQPAHLYFLAGFITIFKGVMIPEKKIKRGFTVTENEIRFKRSFFSKTQIIPVENLIKIVYVNNEILFTYTDSTVIPVLINNAPNGIEMAEMLNKVILN